MTSTLSLTLMAMLTSNILIILTVVILGNNKLLPKIGYPVLIGMTGLILLRLLFLFELPFTTSIRLPNHLSLVISSIRHPLWETNHILISIWSIFVCVWIIGFIISFSHYIYYYIKMIHVVKHHQIAKDDSPYSSILEQICREENIHNSFRIVIDDVDCPCLFGIIKPYIIMPLNIDKGMTQHEIYLILRHEIAHHFHHDLLIKLIINIITIIYWWNPLCKIMKHQADVILDMRIDHKLTNGDSDAITSYLNCLIKVAENKSSPPCDNTNLTVSVCKNTGFLTKRFETLTYTKKHCMTLCSLALLSAIALFCLSYCVIFEAHYYNSEIKGVIKDLNEINIYAKINEKGNYDIYFGDTYIETVDSLEKFPVDKIYNVKGDLIQ